MPNTPDAPVDVPESAPEPLRGKKSRLPLWIGLAVAAVVLVAAAIVLPQVLSGDKDDTAAPTPTPTASSAAPPVLLAGELDVDTLYADKFTILANGETYEFEREGAWDHDGPCKDGAKNAKTEQLLASCLDRLEAAYETKNGKYRLDQQIFVFEDVMTAVEIMRKHDFDGVELNTEAEGEMPGAYAWNWSPEHHLLIVTMVGPTEKRGSLDDKVGKTLTGPIKDRTENLIRKQLHW